MKPYLIALASTALCASQAIANNKTGDADTGEEPPVTASSIIEEYTSEAAAALRSYLVKNPAATDKVEALDFLIEATGRLGDNERRLEHLKARYELLPKGADAEPGEFFAIFQELVATHSTLGDKDGGRAALETARTDLADHPNSARLLEFIDQIGASLKQPAIGDTMDIKFTSVQGDEIDLSAMRGKVVLVDFWATWCKPCIVELPNVKATYEKLKDQGFEVIGISLDQENSKKRLDGYIEEGETPWPQAYDGKGWQNEIAQQFGITSIPATYLIGKDGKIAATNLRGPDLEKAVREQLAKE